MSKQQPIEIFMPPNMLKAKVGGSVVGLDMSAVKRAEQALANLKQEFGDWIAADVQKLAECRDGFASNPNLETLEDLSLASLDLKGQARTFEFPLVERIASSLCKLLGECDAFAALSLVDAHVAAIKVIVRDKITERDNATATMLASELETRVGEHLARAKSGR
jgi:hypothetical protein